MTWDVDLVLMLRIMIGDSATPQTYSDAYLEQVLIAAGIQVESEFPFDYTYVYDISASTIAPDPIVNADYQFQSLVPLKAACILIQGEFRQSLGQGIKVRDGDSAIDTSVSFRGYRDILELGPCKAYEKLKWSLIATGATSGGGVGKAVLGPRRQSGGITLNTISWYYDQIARGANGRNSR